MSKTLLSSILTDLSMNQPSEDIPLKSQEPENIGPATRRPYLVSPLTNLLARLRKSEHSRKNTSGAFGGKARSKRHTGRF